MPSCKYLCTLHGQYLITGHLVSNSVCKHILQPDKFFHFLFGGILMHSTKKDSTSVTSVFLSEESPDKSSAYTSYPHFKPFQPALFTLATKFNFNLITAPDLTLFITLVQVIFFQVFLQVLQHSRCASPRFRKGLMQSNC